jgi:hypothetical protein
MTHTKDEALKLALEALKEYCEHGAIFMPLTAVKALEEALAAPVQEPVAWVREHELPLAPGDAFSWVETFVHKTPLYTNPPAQPAPLQEPVAFVDRTDLQKVSDHFEPTISKHPVSEYDVGLYTAEKRQWVHATPWRGLTDEEIIKATENIAGRKNIAQAIEAKLRSKNT